MVALTVVALHLTALRQNLAIFLKKKILANY